VGGLTLVIMKFSGKGLPWPIVIGHGIFAASGLIVLIISVPIKVIINQGRIFMNPNTKDQEWQQLRSRIEKFVGHFLKEDLLAIECKMRIAGLLQAPPKYSEENAEEKS